jgi:hypothetical protein
VLAVGLAAAQAVGLAAAQEQEVPQQALAALVPHFRHHIRSTAILKTTKLLQGNFLHYKDSK